MVQRFHYFAALLASRLLVVLSPLIPKKKSLVLFGNRCGSHYGDNSQHLFEWMLAHRKDIDAVWVARKSEVFGLLKRTGRPVVSSESLRGVWLLSRAGAGMITTYLDDIALDGAAIPASLKVIYLSHGKSVKATCLATRDPKSATRMMQAMGKFHSVTRYAIATSSFTAGLTEVSQGVQAAVTGYPRNDVLLSPPESAKAVWSEYVGELRFRKVILYAPTMRWRGAGTRFFPFTDFDRASLFDFLQSRGILLLLRPHMNDLRRYPAVGAFIDQLVVDGGLVRSASSEVFPDVSMLIPFVDVLVSDYSSLYHEFLLLDRPLVFVPYDHDEFSRRPGFMYDYFGLLPGPPISSFHDFCSHLDLLCRGEDPFREKRRALRDKIHAYQDSKSCERVAALLDRVLQDDRR